MNRRPYEIATDPNLDLGRKLRLKLRHRPMQMRLKIRRLLKSFLPVHELGNKAEN